MTLFNASIHKVDERVSLDELRRLPALYREIAEKSAIVFLPIEGAALAQETADVSRLKQRRTDPETLSTAETIDIIRKAQPANERHNCTRLSSTLFVSSPSGAIMLCSYWSKATCAPATGLVTPVMTSSAGS